MDSSLYEKYKHLGDDDLHRALLTACKENNLEDVRYLLTSDKLKVQVDIHHFQDRALILACSNGNLDIVKYLLSSPELKEHADQAVDNYYPLVQACSHRHLDIIKYLLTSSDLKEHSDLHIYDDEPFKIAMEQNYHEILNYFIFDLNIPKTENIEFKLRVNPSPQIESMFKNRDLLKDLNANLVSSNNINTKKIKL